MKRGKPDPAGRGINVRLDRKWETGRDWDSGAPEVYRADGNPWDEAVDGKIGNGSYGRVLVIVTPLPDQGVVSTRLEKIKVLDHVKFENADDSFGKDESGYSSSPPASQDTPAETPQTENSPTIEDEIPF